VNNNNNNNNWWKCINFKKKNIRLYLFMLQQLKNFKWVGYFKGIK